MGNICSTRDESDMRGEQQQNGDPQGKSISQNNGKK